MRKEQSSDQLGRTAVKQNIHGTMNFLFAHSPFDLMEPGHLAWMVERCQLRFFARGDAIIRPTDGPVEFFHIVKQGLVRGERLIAGQPEPDTTFEISTGECFPLAALIGGRATRTEHKAAEDTFCLMLSRADFLQLVNLSPPFRDFALRGVSSLLDLVNKQAQREARQTLGSLSLDESLGSIAIRQPVTASPDTPIQQAVRDMHEASVGSVVITSTAAMPLGIFTLRDLRRLVAEGAIDLQASIDRVMTPAPYCLPSTASAFDAAMAMTREHIGHICVMEGERLLGVVSERDLFALQRVDLVHLARAIANSPDVTELVRLRREIHRLVDSMLAHGASASQLTHIITLLNDQTVCRVIELCLRSHGDPQIPPFTWLCFGSEARGEQTLHTDQDNGILFEAEDDRQAESIRQQLLPLARRINQTLAECGFALCPGNIMASNPQLCLSRREWHRRFAQCIRSATPGNLLASSIFFDLRAVWGDTSAASSLFEDVLAMIADAPDFQHLLARNALGNRPPVGFFREFVMPGSGQHRHTLDLKIQGLAPFVDAVRVLALANGVQVTGTLQRLDELRNRQLIGRLDAEAYDEAYQFIQLLRMQQHQLQEEQQLPYSNRLDPATLNQLDRRILRESLRQARRLQASLAMRYQL